GGITLNDVLLPVADPSPVFSGTTGVRQHLQALGQQRVLGLGDLNGRARNNVSDRQHSERPVGLRCCPKSRNRELVRDGWLATAIAWKAKRVGRDTTEPRGAYCAPFVEMV